MLLLFLLRILIYLTTDIAKAQPYCNTTETFTSNSTYEHNLNAAISSLSPNVGTTGFYNTTAGHDPDTVYAMVICRGDLSQSSCRDCIDANINGSVILSQCSNNKEAIAFADLCTIRYSDRSAFGVLTLNPFFVRPGSGIATNPRLYNRELRALLDSLKVVAAKGGSLRKVAAGNRSVSGQSGKIHAIVQCTPDLSVKDCDYCLTVSINDVPKNGELGAWILRLSCSIRYDNYYFFVSPIDEVPQEPLPPEEKSGGKIRIVLVVVFVPVVLLLVRVLFIILRRKKKQRQRAQDFRCVDEEGLDESLQYDFDIIRTATDDFSDANKLGEGGFGAVYKGIFPNKQEIAVKRLSAHSGQGDLEFMNEVSLVAKLQHKNLASLMGFCLHRSERLLVYEFARNRSLDQILFDPIKCLYLDWHQRYKIIVGVARGLLYLHEDSRLRIVHRDMKAGNVLLDEEMNPKITDFGMAKLFVHGETQGNSRRVLGTYGYMPPEYALQGKFSVKTDVFSFGMLVLEIISGQKSTGFVRDESIEVLPSYAWNNWHKGTAEQVIDPVLRDTTNSISDILRCLQIGLLCVQESADDRPTMSFVVLMLSSLSVSLPKPSRPAFYMGSFDGENSTLRGKTSASSSSSRNTTINVVSESELCPR